MDCKAYAKTTDFTIQAHLKVGKFCMVAQEHFCMVAIVNKIMKKFIPKIWSHKVSQRCMHELLSF